MVTVQIDDRVLQLAKRALSTWGFEAQLNQSMGECGELIAALNHWHQRRPEALLEITREMADVYIMLAQLVQTIELEEFERALDRSLNRLECKLDEHDLLTMEAIAHDTHP